MPFDLVSQNNEIESHRLKSEGLWMEITKVHPANRRSRSLTEVWNHRRQVMM